MVHYRVKETKRLHEPRYVIVTNVSIPTWRHRPDSSKTWQSKGYLLLCGSSVSKLNWRLHLEMRASSRSSAAVRLHTSFRRFCWRSTEAPSTRFPLWRTSKQRVLWLTPHLGYVSILKSDAHRATGLNETEWGEGGQTNYSLCSRICLQFVFHSQPLDVVLGLFRNELDPFQDVGYVVDAPLLDMQDLRGPVQVHHAVSWLGQEVQKALGGQVQGGVIARLFRQGARNWEQKEHKTSPWKTLLTISYPTWKLHILDHVNVLLLFIRYCLVIKATQQQFKKCPTSGTDVLANLFETDSFRDSVIVFHCRNRCWQKSYFDLTQQLNHQFLWRNIKIGE